MKILIADDHSLILEGFSNLIRKQLPENEVFVAENKQELFELLHQHPIDILFQDVKFGHHDAREFIKIIKNQFPNIKIIVISTLSDEFTVNTLLNQGIDGYISKSDNSIEILRAIEVAIQGQVYISTNVKQNTSVRRINKNVEIVLTSREKQVLSMIINGKTIKETAAALFLSEKTIETYRSNLFLKFNVSNLAALVKKAILAGYM